MEIDPVDLEPVSTVSNTVVMIHLTQLQHYWAYELDLSSLCPIYTKHVR